MAHLKKLSDRLGMTYKPILKEIVTVGGKNEELLQIPAGRIGNISKKIRQFYIPSLTITAAHNNLACLSAPQIGFSLAAFAIHKNLEDNK